MNEEISRILHLLEDGKISADEAERLLRAVRPEAQPSAGPSPQPAPEAAPEEPVDSCCPAAFRDLEGIFTLLGAALRRAVRRQRRWTWWRWYQVHDWQEDARRRRDETASTWERVRFLLRERVVVDRDDFGPGTPLRDLGMGRIGRDILRWALEQEFQIQVPAADLETLATVQSVVDYVDRRLHPTPAAAPQAEAHDAPAAPEEDAPETPAP